MDDESWVGEASENVVEDGGRVLEARKARGGVEELECGVGVLLCVEEP